MTDDRPGSEYVYDALLDAGIEVVIGLPGTQTLPIDRTVTGRDEMAYVMARHETAVPHVAWGYYETSGTPAATLTVPGPGDTNAMHGLKNALEDCVPIVHVSADVNPEDRGKGPIHEIEPDTYDNVVKENVRVERAAELPAKVAQGVEAALTPPYGPVRLGVPSGLLDAEFAAPTAEIDPEEPEYDNRDGIARARDALSSAERPAIYVGGGARRSSGARAVVADLAEALDAPVATSYKGKGIFPEDDPRWLGVTGSHFPEGGRRVLDAADVVLALGTDFDGVTTSGWEIPMGETLVHVNLDPGEIGAAYEADVAIAADVADAGRAILDGLDAGATWDGGRIASAVREEYEAALADLGLFDGESPTTTAAAIAAVREAAPRETIVANDVGGFRLWSFQTFETDAPERYVSAGSWAGMGVGLPAAIGAKLANPGAPVICLTGDGGLMMCLQELHTAAEYGLDIAVVVMNNADYAIISKSPKIAPYTDGREFEWRSPDFTALAEGFGATATAVESAEGVREAVGEALGGDGPHLIDVSIRPEEPTAPEAASYESAIDLDG